MLEVSIPNRDFSEFKRNSRMPPLASRVSIPNRDFSEFKQRASERLTVFSFQGAFARLLEIIAF